MPIVRIERRQGRSSVSGGPSILAELGSTMIDFEVGFESLPGTKSAPKREHEKLLADLRFGSA